MKWTPEPTPNAEVTRPVLVEWLKRSFEKLSQWSDRVSERGYGGITKATDTNYGTVGSGAWTTIDNWDAGMLALPVGVTQDVANSGLRINAPGIYRLTGVFAISFTDTNSGRTFGVRLWDATTSTPGRVVEYYVGRNQDGVNISQAAILAEIPSAQVGDLLQIQIAGVGDSFSNVAVVDALFSTSRVG